MSKNVVLGVTGSIAAYKAADLASQLAKAGCDLRVVMTGLANAGDSQAVTIHFGASEFIGKYKMLIDNFSQWQANAGRVQSIDLQYSRQVVVNPDTSAGTTTARKR